MAIMPKSKQILVSRGKTNLRKVSETRAWDFIGPTTKHLVLFMYQSTGKFVRIPGN
jgi:hypothetical protein